MSRPTAQKKLITRLVVTGGVVVLAVAMLFNTKFLTPEEVDALTPDEFDPQATAQQLHSTTQEEISGASVELSDVAAALDEDAEAAAEEFEAQEVSEGVLAYPVSLTGTVQEASADNLVLTVEGIDQGRQISVPLTTAVDGNLIRDISDFSFGEAPGQTEYQQVGSEISSLMRSDVDEALGGDPEAHEGEDITVEGFLRYTTTDSEGPDERPLIIQPLTVELGS